MKAFMSAAQRAMPSRTPAERYQLESRMLLEALYWRSGTDLRDRAPQGVTEVVDALREEMGLQTITALIEQMVHDDLALQRVHDRLRARLLAPDSDLASAPHSARNADIAMVDHWCNHVVPLLRSTPFPGVWIHDCSDTALLAQLVGLLNESDLSRRSTLFVTCAEASAVEALRHQLQHAPPILAGKTPASIIVAQYNVQTDGTFNEFDFILCGTVLRRLATSAQRRVLRLLGESLTPCGVLQLLAPDSADAARVAPIFLPMTDSDHLYRHALLEHHAQRRRQELR